MAEFTVDPKEFSEIANARAQIISNTPNDCDPLMYWHQLALDALREADKYRKAGEAEKDQLERLEHYQSMEETRIRRELQDRAFPNMRELLSRVKKGDFSMNVQFSFYPNVETERKGGYDNDDE